MKTIIISAILMLICFTANAQSINYKSVIIDTLSIEVTYKVTESGSVKTTNVKSQKHYVVVYSNNNAVEIPHDKWILINATFKKWYD